MAERVTTRVVIPCFLYADFAADTDEEIRAAVRQYIADSGLEDGCEHLPDGGVLYTELGYPSERRVLEVANRTVEEEPELRKYRVGVYLQGANIGDPDEITSEEVMAASEDAALEEVRRDVERTIHFGYEVEEVDEEDEDGETCEGCGRGEGVHDADCPLLEEM
jgi:hypothetical protein